MGKIFMSDGSVWTMDLTSRDAAYFSVMKGDQIAYMIDSANTDAMRKTGFCIYLDETHGKSDWTMAFLLQASHKLVVYRGVRCRDYIAPTCK